MSEDLRRILSAITGKEPAHIKRGRNELLAKEYFKLLTTPEHVHVQEWLGHVESLNRSGKDYYVVMATGSILRPQIVRAHPPQDIDLRILHSSKPDTSSRKAALYELQASILRKLKQTKHSYQLEPPVTDYGFGHEISFRIKYNEGLPIHITYPGAGSRAAQDYLDSYERKIVDETNYFAVLLNPAEKRN